MEIRQLFASIKLKDEASAAVDQIKKSMDGAKESAFSMERIFQTIGGAEVASKVIGFGKEMFTLASHEEAVSLQVKNLAEQDYPALAASMEAAVKASKGMVEDADMTEAAARALKFGASVDFIKNNLSSMQQLAAVSGEDLATSMQRISMAAEYGNVRVLRGMPILNKHTAQIEALGKGTDEYSKAAREALITRIFSEEQNNLAKKYTEVLKTSEGATKIFTAQIKKIKEVWGKMIKDVITPFIRMFDKVLLWFTQSEKHMAKLKTVLIAVSVVLGVVMVGAIYLMTTALWAAVTAAIGLDVALSPFILIGIGIVAAITAIILVVEDLYYWFTGGNSLMGVWFGSFEKNILKLRIMFLAWKVTIIGAFNDVIKWFKSIPGAIKDYFNEAVDWIIKKLTSFSDWVLNLPGIKQVAAWFKSSPEESKAPKGKASGGAVSKNKPYIVGERGPELFSPSSDGSISSAGTFGKGFSIGNLVGTLTINVSGSKEAGQAVEMAVMDALNKLSRTIMRSEMGMVTS